MNRYTDVFVPGGFPKHTYNPRETQQLEAKLSSARDNLCKLTTVTGHTKSGKTVLVRKIFPPDESLWIDGGTISTEEDFWSTVINQLELFQQVEISNSTGSESEFQAKGTAGANFLITKGESEIGGSLSSSKENVQSGIRTVSSRVAALAGLKDSRRPLVVDDFHYIPKELQGDLIRTMKPLIFDGQPIVIIAIPHRRYDAIRVEKEMTARMMPIEVPSWSPEELTYIPKIGFAKLNASIGEVFSLKIAKESIGSPHLMQEFCRAICREEGIEHTNNGNVVDQTDAEVEKVFRDAAETIGRPIFEKLARGPRHGSERIDRQLLDGKSVDIYGLVLNALATLRPDLITLQYDDIRNAVKSTCLNDPPRMHEITRVLRHMSQIAATDQSSSPVIDFDDKEKQLHVTDPFFAFYLRWGNLEG